MRGKISRYTLCAGSIVSLVLLSGCEWFTGKEDKGTCPSGVCAPQTAPKTQAVQPGQIPAVKLHGPGDKVLVSIDGVVVITLSSFEEEYNRLIEENPQLQQMAAFIPNLKENILDGLIGQLVMDKWVSVNKIDQTAEYKQDFDRLVTQLSRMLNRKYFTQKHPASVTDAEIKKFYEENKDKVPGLIVSAGGVRTTGVKFEKQDAAKTFLDTVKGKSKEFDKLAKDAGLSVKDLKLVNDQSVGVNEALRAKIIGLTRFPSIDMIKVSDNEIWVINATGKEEKQFRPFDEVKEYLKNDLEREKEMKTMEAAIDKLKTEYNVEIDKEAAQTLKPEMPEQGIPTAQGEQPEEEVAPARATKAA